ncbi:AraC family transcriptional regulator [Algoriphagus boseongensis]|uniref:AraC family transcriptional regulator n=1 Tax=Algoriphagus boseongensis TaxID=1442587 RepID=A0A4R6TBU3_9BACT|nr:AraC family transcriptional regulator [Algoriphagus boseongensis]TDQ19689.1 AraC family transcriptional regulator [Algoriphagus boseongensis]
MEFVLGLKDLIYLGSIFIGFLTSAVLIFYAQKRQKSNILIGFSFLAISYGIILAFLISSGYHVFIPQLYRTGNIAGLLFAPLSYLYIRNTAKKQKLAWTDFIHFLPAIIYTIDFFPILFLTSVEEKARLIQSEIADPSVFVYFNQSRFFPPNFYTLGRTILIGVYWLFSFRILQQYSKSQKESGSTFGKEWTLWMKIYISCHILLFLPFFILYQIADSQLYFELIHFTGALVILTNSITILFFPKVLYGLSDSPIEYGGNQKSQKDENPEPIPEEKAQFIQQQLELVLDQNQKFLEKGYSINDLANDSSVPSYLLTQYLNRNLDISFSDLINKKRIEACCAKISSGEFGHLTLEALAEDCGFNNRNSFIASFKKFKGCTPSQFSKEQQVK